MTKPNPEMSDNTQLKEMILKKLMEMPDGAWLPDGVVEASGDPHFLMLASKRKYLQEQLEKLQKPNNQL